jgi:hypothetical protein
LNSRLDVSTNTLVSPVLRAPCIHEYLQGFITKSGEKCGLSVFKVRFYEKHGFM